MGKRRAARWMVGMLCLGMAVWAEGADRSYAATIGIGGAGHAAASTVPPMADPADPNGPLARSALLGGEAWAVVDLHSAPDVQTGGLNAVTRAILRLRACACSGFDQIFDFSGPVSTRSTAPALPAPAAPGAMLLFMIGIVTVAGVTRRSPSGVAPSPGSTVRPQATGPARPGYLLLVSDDSRLMGDVGPCFTRHGFAVESAQTIAEAERLAALQRPALVLVDRRQPDWQVLRRFAPFEMVPMMTVVPVGSGADDEDCLDDLDRGMDGTHVCDGNVRLLVAKVRALLRRSAWLEQAPTVIRRGQVELDIDRVEVRVAGQVHHLPPIQFKLLKCLMESPGRVFRRQELLDHIWGQGYAVEGHTLDVHICWLRRLLAHDPFQRQTITTIRGVGIKFVVGRDRVDSAKGCRLRTGKMTVRTSPVRLRHRSRRLRVVGPAAVRTAV